jgi:hypothetical protein
VLGEKAVKAAHGGALPDLELVITGKPGVHEDGTVHPHDIVVNEREFLEWVLQGSMGVQDATFRIDRARFRQMVSG